MARTLTKKQRGFVNDYADTGNGTQAALANYDTESERVAEAIGSENLSKPIIVDELKKMGFDSNNAKRVVGEILNDDVNPEPRDRLKAAELIFKVGGDFAPEKSLVGHIELKPSEDIEEYAIAILGQQKAS